MDTKLLDKYPNISNVLSEHFKDNYLKIGSVINSQILTLYSVFVDVSSIDEIHVQDDRQIRLLNSEKTFVQTYQQFIGFIYTELD
ncbi:hypothetical protein, partial [Vibrio atlanticus]